MGGRPGPSELMGMDLLTAPETSTTPLPEAPPESDED